MQAATPLDDSGAPAPLVMPTQALTQGFELAAELAASPQAPAMPATMAGHDAMRRQGFAVGKLHLMIRYEDGSELTDLPPVFPLPRAPAWFLGMTNLHGTLVPVFDAATLFGIAHVPDCKQMLLVLGHGDEKAGLVIDGLPKRLTPQMRQRLEETAVPPVLSGCVSDVYRIDDTDWMDFNYAALFDSLASELAR